MGNSASHVNSSDIESSSFSLDVLGGWNRPAIKRGDSLNKKLEWLQVQSNTSVIDFNFFLECCPKAGQSNGARAPEDA